MNTQMDLLFVEELSEQELKGISGGQRQQTQQGLVNIGNVNVEDVAVNVAVAAFNDGDNPVIRQTTVQ
jgi:bacteriocin-like protein